MEKEEMENIVKLWNEKAREVLGTDYPEDLQMGVQPHK